MKSKIVALATITLLGLVAGDPVHAAPVVFGTGANQFSMEFVPIGNPNNAPDTVTQLNLGSVAYTYQIGKYEVSRDMVNKASVEGNLGISLPNMISFNPSDVGGNGADRPATGSLFQMMRFVNWLNTSQGYQAAYKFDSLPGESGYDSTATNRDWLPTDAGYDPNNIFRNTLAHYVVSNYDEWYKAAYFNPATGAYTNYATGSDLVPTAVASGTDPNTAVYGSQIRPADITEAGGLSAYGTMAQTGNVREWMETQFNRINYFPASGFQNHYIPGGGYRQSGVLIQKGLSVITEAQIVNPTIGFRIAIVPETSTMVMTAVGLCLLCFLVARARLHA